MFPAKTFAHVLQANRDVGVIMHIAPDDDPVAGKESEIFLEFKDPNGKFDPKNCDCSILITTNDSNLYYKKIFGDQNTKQTLLLPFTFPEKGIYNIEITGKPKKKDAFGPFNISFDVRVSRDILENTNYNSYLLYLPLVVSVLFGMIILFFFIKKHNKK